MTRNENNNLQTKSRAIVYNSLAWILFAITIIFIFFYLIPRKGIDFSDEGFLLYEAMAFANNYNFDPIIPQAPVFVINGLLMDFGIKSYLYMRYAYYFLIALSMYLLLSGIDNTKKYNYLIPLGMSFGLLTSFMSVLSYQNAPLLFLFIALGLFFRALDNSDQNYYKIVAVFAGIFLSLSCIVNVTLLPAACLCCLIMFITHNEKKIILISSSIFLFCTILFFCWYLSKIGFNAFFQAPAEHRFDFSRIKIFLNFSLQWPLFFAIIFIPLKILFHTLKKNQVFITSIIKIFHLVCMPLLCLLFLIIISQQAFKTEHLFFPQKLFIQPRDFFFYWIGILPGQILFNIIAIFGWAVLSLSLLAMNSINKNNKRILICTFCCFTYWFFQMFFSLMSVPLSPIFYTGAMLSLGFFLWHDSHFNNRYNMSKAFKMSMSVSATFALATCLMFSLFWNQSGWTSIITKKEEINLPMLGGIMETPERKTTLNNLYAAFKENKCSEKVLITFESTPLLYFFFEKQAPEGLTYIRPLYIYPEEKLFNVIKTSKKWCVFYSRNSGEGGEKTGLKTKPLLDFIIMNSSKIIKIQSGKSLHSHDDFILYLN